MREILELCVQLDTTARDAYAKLAECCTNGELSTIFARMSREEASHVDWWSELLHEWEAGRVPRVGDTDELMARLRATSVSVQGTMALGLESLSIDAVSYTHLTLPTILRV